MIQSIFQSAETSNSYSFYLSKNLRVTHQVFSIVETAGTGDWKFTNKNLEALDLEMGSVYHRLNLLSQRTKLNKGELIFTFRESIEKLASFSTTETAEAILQKSRHCLADILESKDENVVVEFFSNMVNSLEVEYTPMTSNRYLQTLKSLCINTLKIT